MEHNLLAESISMPKQRSWRTVLTLVGWVAGLFGSLMISQFPFADTVSMCGVWGCYPPLQAVVSMHLFWLTALVGPVYLLTRYRPCTTDRLGKSLLLIGLLGMAILVGLDLARWLSTVPDFVGQFWLRRVQHTLLTHTDIPVMELALVGLGTLYFGGKSSCHSGGTCGINRTESV